MTEIKRAIEIAAPQDRVWDCVHPRNWTKVFNFVDKVDGYDGTGNKPHASVIAGDNDSAISYNIEVTDLDEKTRIAYRRYGGPLTGKGEIQLRALQNGTLLTRTGIYEDNLSEETIDLLSKGMEKDNLKIKRIAEEKS
ncbi:MAG: SRPBCC family protein [bacterium]